MSESKPIASLFADKIEPGAYRVEAIDDDGGCEVAIFSGPLALDRAIRFADAYYNQFELPGE